MPNISVVADPRVSTFTKTDNVAWTLPIDDTTTRIFTAFRMGPAPTSRGCRRSRTLRCTAASRGTSSTTKATSATPATTKRKSAKDESPFIQRSSLRQRSWRRMFRTRLQARDQGSSGGADPQCVARTDDAALVRLQAGNYLVQPSTTAD